MGVVIIFGDVDAIMTILSDHVSIDKLSPGIDKQYSISTFKHSKHTDH